MRLQTNVSEGLPMGYADHALRHYASSAKRKASIYSIDGGVDYSSDITDDNKAKKAENLTVENGILRSRREFADLEGTSSFSGDIHSYKSFDTFALIHAGNTAYKISDGTLETLYSEMPDYRSVMVAYKGRIYIYCSSHVYSYALDGQSAFAEEIPTSPLYKKDYDCTTHSGIPVSGFVPNILAPYVSVTYNLSNFTGEHGGAFFVYPSLMNRDRLFRVYYKDEPVPDDKMWVQDTGFEIDRSYAITSANIVKISYFSTERKLDKSNILKDCKVGIAYGGATLDGTKIFLSGDENFKGEYFTSELADPMCFFEGNGGIIGEGNENIKAFSRQSSYLLVFTENTVSKISYGFNENTGGYFTSKKISVSVGCASENGAVLVGNKNVFASKDGIYMVCDTGADSQNTAPLSNNISDYSGNRGYNSVSHEDIQKSVCCVHDRKYMLLVNDRIFVLDLGYAPYASSSDSLKAEKRLCWTEWTGIRADIIFSVGKRLYIIDCSGETNVIKAETDGIKLASAYVLRPMSLDFNFPHENKIVERIMMEFRCAGKNVVNVKVFADGKEYYSRSVDIEPGDDGCASLYLNLPKAFMKRFDYEISGDGAFVGIFNFRADYRLMKKESN